MKYKNISVSDFLPELNGMCKVQKWIKKEGENISKGDFLIAVVVDNEVYEITSLWSGEIIKIYTPINQVVSTKTIIAEILITN